MPNWRNNNRRPAGNANARGAFAPILPTAQAVPGFCAGAESARAGQANAIIRRRLARGSAPAREAAGCDAKYANKPACNARFSAEQPELADKIAGFNILHFIFTKTKQKIRNLCVSFATA
ncbi:MAG TPA: hypothetical protein IAA75_06615 [Candidatus Pullichristensenella avicola]|nr:hypothetical protein [Candidatus Pullichristensenella avicola]